MSECVEPLDGHPYSDLHVLRTLRRHAPLTYGELHEETGLPESTFDDALSRLRDAGLVKREQNITDGRETIYRPDDDILPRNPG